MTKYDLSEFANHRWVRFRRWFRVGIVAFIILMVLSIGYRLAQEGYPLDGTHLLGVAALGWILGMFAFVALTMREQGIEVDVSLEGVTIRYHKGAPYVVRWSDQKLKINGRFSPGTPDFISQMRPLWSIYGRFGGLTESFIPQEAYLDLLARARDHGLDLIPRDGRNGWTLYYLR